MQPRKRENTEYKAIYRQAVSKEFGSCVLNGRIGGALPWGGPAAGSYLHTYIHVQSILYPLTAAIPPLCTLPTLYLVVCVLTYIYA